MALAGGQLTTYPGARRPDRRRVVDAHGVGLAVYEWGDVGAAPLLLTHGGFDFAATFDSLAPRLVEGGWRVVAWDQRGHGDSEHAALYSWDADVRDLSVVLDTVGAGALPLLGHSKGGGLTMQLAEAAPHRVSHLINLDGLPSRRPPPDIAEHERTRQTLIDVTTWLDHRRRTHEAMRKPGTFEEIARRRARLNPRIDHDWIRYLASVGAREDADGWRWKIDPSLRFGGFGPFRPEWSMERAPGIGVPFLGVLGLEGEEMGWGARPEDVEPYLPPGAEFHALEGVGHFLHVEQPGLVADLVLDFLIRRPGPEGWR
ncbi:MAG: alpha/beta fold hydrolase [Acidimicrobiia bacterium]|nr:alpha/beta fold hydrolase [Acidimicrobiia bacterium]